MKRILPLLLVLTLGATVFGCASKDKDKNNQPAKPGGPAPNTTAEEINTNPVEGVAPPTPVLETGAFTDGPAWHAGMGVLFFSTPLGDGALFRMLPDGRILKVRDGNQAPGTTPIGNTINAGGEVVTVEAKRVVRSAPEGGEPTVIALSYGGAPTGDGTFDTLNDVVARKDGTLYVTDPGYFVTPIANRIYRIDGAGGVQVVETFEDVPRPNGVALSPDESTLYVGFSAPTAGTLPFIRKYIVNADGTLGEWTKFVDVGPGDSSPDGLTVDKVGNLYIATRAGIEVFRPDGKPWGVVPMPEKPTGMSFGGEDMKTLYVTTEGVKIWQLKLKIAGISQ